MSKKISKFQFKQFAVSHHRSSMKVGVDGVLISCWVDPHGARRILDVGTGCGLIALIMAQRSPEAEIDAIDIDVPSIEEAKENFDNSPWQSRLKAQVCPYSELPRGKGYDLIISNPPYFDSGVTEIVTAREKARHQGELSPLSLLKGALGILKPGGSIAMIVPTEIYAELEAQAKLMGYRPERKCFVRGHLEAPYKRVMIQWGRSTNAGIQRIIMTDFLTLEISAGVPTEDYRELCKDFYLRF